MTNKTTLFNLLKDGPPGPWLDRVQDCFTNMASEKESYKHVCEYLTSGAPNLYQAVSMATNALNTFEEENLLDLEGT